MRKFLTPDFADFLDRTAPETLQAEGEFRRNERIKALEKALESI